MSHNSHGMINQHLRDFMVKYMMLRILSTFRHWTPPTPQNILFPIFVFPVFHFPFTVSICSSLEAHFRFAHLYSRNVAFCIFYFLSSRFSKKKIVNIIHPEFDPSTPSSVISSRGVHFFWLNSIQIILLISYHLHAEAVAQVEQFIPWEKYRSEFWAQSWNLHLVSWYSPELRDKFWRPSKASVQIPSLE